MTFKRTWIVLLVAGALVLTTAVAAKPAHFTAINYPGAISTFAYGINPAGDIVGSYVDTANHERGFLLTAGVFISIDWAGSNWTQAWSINPRGDIVGQYQVTQNGVKTTHGFLLRDDELFPIDAPGQANTMPVRISPEGVIVGCYHTGLANGTVLLDTMFGFVLDADSLTSHASSRTMNNGLNAAGDIVGTYFSPTTGRAEDSYLIHDGEQTWFRYPGSVVTQAQDINASGTIVGWHRTSLTGPLPLFHGFVRNGDEITSFDAPGATDTRAFGISPTGDIVGYFRDATGYHGFLLSHRDPQ